MNRPSIVCIKKKQAEWNDRALPVFQKLAECYILLSRKITSQNVTSVFTYHSFHEYVSMKCLIMNYFKIVYCKM